MLRHSKRDEDSDIEHKQLYLKNQHSSASRPKEEKLADREIDRNEELMSLLACLNEQAINEINTQSDKEIETG